MKFKDAFKKFNQEIAYCLIAFVLLVISIILPSWLTVSLIIVLLITVFRLAYKLSKE